MAVTLIPYGQLADGKFGIKLSDSTGDPIAAVIEVFTTLPSVGDLANFDGRMAFDTTAQTLYVFLAGTPEWFPLEGIPAEVGAVAGSPPTVPVPADGFLFYDTDTEVMFVWDGTDWRPIGGRFAARYVEQTTISSGFAGVGGDTFSLGTTPVYSEFVEVFLDGIRQVPNPGGDYNIIGSSIVFPAPIPISVVVYTRSLVSTVLNDPSILPNAQCIRATYSNQAAGITDFDIGAAGLDPSCTMVFKNGSLLSGGGIDYIMISGDTTINAINKVAATTGRVTTAAAHGAAVGDVVTITGAAESEYTGNFTINTITSTTEFEITILITAPVVATLASGSIPISYSPPMVNDSISLNTPTILNDDIVIISFQRIIVAPSSGEANTVTNLGSGVGLFSTKTGVDLRFSSLSGGNGILVTDVGSGTVSISADGVSTFEARVGINSSVYNLGITESMIGVRDTSSVVTIDLSAVPAGTSGSGRKVIVTDESGGAGINNIQIAHAGATFNGAPSPLLINVGYGSVTIIYDGNDWTISSKTF
jgi:hypothetical protein